MNKKFLKFEFSHNEQKANEININNLKWFTVFIIGYSSQLCSLSDILHNCVFIIRYPS
jgi:hypothetical protein